MLATKGSVIIAVFHSYIRPLFTLSQVALTSSTFLIMAASFERYTTICVHAFFVYTQRKRVITRTWNPQTGAHC